MPRMDQAPPSNRLVKMLLIAEGKAGKTFYAGQAAEDGFNVLYLDGDVGSQTLTQLPIELQRNIYLMAMHDGIDGGLRDTNFAESMSGFMSNIKFRWNDSKGRPAKRTDVDDEIWEIRPAQMDHNCVLVIDSWTSYIESLMLKVARENNVDLTTATTTQMRPVYLGGGQRATAALQIIRAIPCHVICIAHPDEYQHKVAPEGRRVGEVKESELEIEYTKMIPKSTSKPHGLLLPKYFTDVAWLTLTAGGRRQLDFRPKPDRVGGGHLEGVKSTEEYSFGSLVRQLGGTVPGIAQPVDNWLTIIPPGESKPAEPQVLDGTKSTPVKGFSGLGALMKG